MKLENPQVIYSWIAPIRAYKKTTQGILRFYIAVALLLSLIVFFVGEKILVLPIWAILFLFYSLTVTPPQYIENKITKFGIFSGENMYKWEDLSSFYFLKKFDYYILVLTNKIIPTHRVYMVIENIESIEEIKKILSENLIFQEKPKKNFTDKMAEWLTKLMPDYKE